MFDNYVNLQGHSAESLSVSTSAEVTTSPLPPGKYAVWSDVDAYIKVHQDSSVADDVTTSTGFKVTGLSNPLPVLISSSAFLAGIAGGDGTLYYHKVD